MLTPQEASLVMAIKSKHDDVVKQGHVVNNQLRNVPHGNVDIESLSRAIGYEGDAIRTLCDLVKGKQPDVPDPAELEDRRELAKEVFDGWSQSR